MLLVQVRDTTTGKLLLQTLEEAVTIEASEALAANDLVQIWDDGGTLKMRKADAASGQEAHGFVKDAVVTTTQGTVYFKGTISDNTAQAGNYYTGNAGAKTQTPTYLVGQVVQYIGHGVPNGVIFTPNEAAFVNS